MIEKNKNGIVTIVLIATFFGLTAGIVGSLTVRSYFGTSSAFWGELNFVNGNLDRPRVIISGAKKVIVAQDEKINENIKLVKANLVGIYRQKATSTKKSIINLDSFYKTGDELGSGLIISSDGWIVTDALDAIEFSEKNIQENISKYVIITDDKKIHKIDKLKIDKATDFIFLHINVRDLPVINIANQNTINPGETVFGLNLKGDTFVSAVSSLRDAGDYLSMSSDFYYDKVYLGNKLSDKFNASFIFDISGEVVLFVAKNGELIPSRVFNVAIESLFDRGVISRPSLGLEYADISHLIYPDIENKGNEYEGALVIGPLSKKETAVWMDVGLKKDDLIMSVNGVSLNKDNNLSKILMNYYPGEDLKLGVLRANEEIEILVELSTLK